MKADEIAQKIISSSLFLKLKDVIENNPWHDNEPVYDHLVKTYGIAKEQIKGDFIKNPDAKKLFLEFVNNDFEEIKMSDVMLITALVHDIGKLLHYKDADKELPLRHVDNQGLTKMPGHEYWGSIIVPEVLEDLDLNEKIIRRVSKVVRLHDTFSDGYFTNMKGAPIEDLVDDVKARAEGLYVQTLFNIYCDVFTATPSIDSIKRIIKIFNSPLLYSKREYFVK